MKSIIGKQRFVAGGDIRMSGAGDRAQAQAAIGVGSLGTQAANSVVITGGVITGITDLAVADGGTGASTAAGARSNLGLTIGVDVQAYNLRLSAIAALAVADGNIIVGDGATWVAESGATARTSLGVGTGDSPQFTNVSLGGSTGYFNTSNGILYLQSRATSSHAFMFIDAQALDGAGVSYISLFRNTTTAGLRRVIIYKGDGTSAYTIIIEAATGDITTSGNLSANKLTATGNVLLGDASTDRVGMLGAPAATYLGVSIQGGIVCFKGVAVDYSNTANDIGTFNDSGNARFVCGQDTSNFGGLSWIYNATPASAYLQINAASNQSLKLQIGGGPTEVGGSLTMTGAFFPRLIASTSAAGTQNEIAVISSTGKAYLCTATGNPATWSALN